MTTSFCQSMDLDYPPLESMGFSQFPLIYQFEGLSLKDDFMVEEDDHDPMETVDQDVFLMDVDV